MDTAEAMELDVSHNEVDNIPIFTQDFLKHNKQRENELRNLKSMVNDYEMKNASLETHISSINATIRSLDDEIVRKKSNNAILYNHLSKIRAILFKEFQAVPIPGTNECPSQENIEQYLARLQESYSKSSNLKEKDKIKQKIASVLAKWESFEKMEN